MRVCVTALGWVLLAATVAAQPPPRVRGVIQAVEGATLVVATPSDGDGRWEATEVHVFPESMRGAGEGHYAWDLPESTITNGVKPPM
jgi:hypothetical protein